MMYKRVATIVISFHLLFIALLLFNPRPAPVKKIAHVRVRQVHQETRPAQPVARTNKVAPPPPARTAKKPVSKPTPPSAPAKPKPNTSRKPAIIEKNKPIKKKEAPTAPKTAPKQEMWNEIDQALAKIEKKSYPVSKQSVDLPKPVLFVDEVVVEDSPMSHLIGFLHETLHLPEVGEVKVEITVTKEGKVIKVVVLSSESQKNKRYLQENLPLLQLPIKLDQDKTWIMTFCNEI